MQGARQTEMAIRRCASGGRRFDRGAVTRVFLVLLLDSLINLHNPHHFSYETPLFLFLILDGRNVDSLCNQDRPEATSLRGVPSREVDVD